MRDMRGAGAPAEPACSRRVSPRRRYPPVLPELARRTGVARIPVCRRPAVRTLFDADHCWARSVLSFLRNERPTLAQGLRDGCRSLGGELHTLSRPLQRIECLPFTG